MNTDYSVYILSRKEKLNYFMVGYVTAFVVAYLFYQSYPFALISGIIPYLFKSLYMDYLAQRRKQFLNVQFKDLLYSFSASIAANRQIPYAMEEALENLRLIYNEDTPMIKELSYIVKQISENRQNELELLLNLGQRSHSEDISNFVQVYLTCRTTGGDLERVLKNTTEMLIDKMNIEKEIKTITAQKKLEGRMISIMPIAVIFFLNIFSPDYLQPLYTTLAGRFIMTGAIGGIVYAYYLISRLTSIEV